MSFSIPEEKLAEIRNAADIVEVISERVALKKAGKDYAGLCPFHSEKTPSFTVSSAKQIFYCFGCGAGGDVFNFLTKFEGISFFEAVQSVARQYGIELPSRRMTASDRQKFSQREKLFEINKKVLAYYRDRLLKKPEGRGALDYLQNRGFKKETIDRFCLGFAPPGWDNLLSFLRKERIPLELGEKAGLIIPRSSGRGYYDRFRNRVIFPINDAAKQVVAFGGRVLDDAEPKYLNSPETPVYSKRRSLYGLDAARDKCRESGLVYIVEGYFDLLAMHQHGIANTVATLGTSLTGSHVRMLKRGYAKKARLVFDSDSAGVKAALRSIGLFMNEALDVEIIVLPQGEDPDSFLFKYGAEGFSEKAENAEGGVEFLIDSAVKTHGLSMQGKIRIVDELKEPLSDITDSVARSLYIRHLSERLGIEEQAVLDQVKNARIRRSKRAAGPGGSGSRGGSEKSREQEALPDRLESRVTAMMLQFPEIVPEIEKQGLIHYFEDKRLKSIAELIISDPPESGEDVSDLLDRVPDESQRQLIASLSMQEENWDHDSCRRLAGQFLAVRKRSKHLLLEQIREAEQKKDNELLFKLLKEKQEQAGK